MVKSVFKINSNRRLGFTLVEIMIAAICFTIIMGPFLLILRSGTNTSLMGVMRNETTEKARAIMKQVYADLKMACFPLGDGAEYNFYEIMSIEGTAPNLTYSFQSYPIHQKYSEIFESPSAGINYRNPSLITYTIENGDNPELPFKKLIRKETFGDKTTERVLSENINFFEIKEIFLEFEGKKQYYYLITLQLLDVLHASDMKNKKSNEKLTENQKDVILADFYDVVYPEFFHALWNDEKPNPNWHTLQQGSD